MNIRRLLFLLIAVFVFGACATMREDGMQGASQEDDFYSDEDQEIEVAAPPSQVKEAEVVESVPAAAPQTEPKLPQTTQSPSKQNKSKETNESSLSELNGEVIEHKVWLWQESKDCLWTLAEKYYGDPWLWKKIYLANRDEIEDPGVIYPKQIIKIPPLDESETE